VCEAENTPNLGIEPGERRTPCAIGRGGPVVATVFTSNGCAINVLLCTKSRWPREYVIAGVECGDARFLSGVERRDVERVVPAVF
jgi:hypothetical protein